MKKQVALFLFLFFMCNTFCFAQMQPTSFIVTGKVQESMTGKPMENVNVSDHLFNTGTSSNSSGQFSIRVKDSSSVLSFSKIGFEKISLSVRGLSAKKFIVKMNVNVSTLNLVTITPAQSESITKKEGPAIIDYGFYGNDLLIVTTDRLDNDHSQLNLVTADGDTLHSVPVYDRPQEIFKDCSGRQYVITKNFAYLIFIAGQKLSYVSRLPVDSFMLLNKPCVADLGDKIVYSERYGSHTLDATLFKFQTNNYLLQYFLLDKSTREADLLETAAYDKKLMQKLNEETGYAVGKALFAQSNALSKYSYIGSSPAYDLYFTSRMLYKEIFAPLANFKEGFYIFNFGSSEIHSYDTKGNQLKSTEMNVGDLAHFKNKIVVDEKTQTVYLLFSDNGATILKSVDVHTGNIIKQIKLPHYFATNEKADNGYIYYLYKDYTSNYTSVLFRLQVDQ